MGEGRQRYASSWEEGRKQQCMCPQGQTLSGVSVFFLGRIGLIMLPQCIGVSELSTDGCVTDVDDGWFAVSHFGQSVCNPILRLAASKYSLCPWSLGCQRAFVMGAKYQWADGCVDFR